jgi:hypothetical protein
MKTLDQLMEETFFAVAATSFEHQCLWSDHAQQSDYAKVPTTVHWKQLPYGYTVQVGTLDNRPVVMTLRWASLDGKLILFWDVCSQVTDSGMVEAWLSGNFHGTWDKGTRRARTDAMNFHHCIHAIKEPKSNDR